MIHDMDRSGYFGASDTRYVVSKNRDTKTWKSWWGVKLGAPQAFGGNKYTEAGNLYEHPIMRSITDEMNLDRQIIYEKYRLRVNYDGDVNGTIYECKTHKASKQFEVTKQYWMQAQVEMYCYKLMQSELELPKFNRLWIVSYALYPDEYDQRAPIDANRIGFHPVDYDKSWVKGVYLPNLKELSRKLKRKMKDEINIAD